MFLKLLHIKHDSDRSLPSQQLQAHIQLRFLANKSEDHIKAWYLHHILDYAEKEAGLFSLEEMLERMADRTKKSEVFDIVAEYVSENWKEISTDLTPSNEE